MSEEAKTVLAQLMERALNGVDAAVEFSQEQIPDVIQQLLVWHSIESIITSVFGLIMIIGYYFIFKYGLRKIAKSENDATGDCMLTGIVGGAISLFYLLFSLSMVSEILTAVKIWIAPKLYLLEYGASLIK